MSIEAYYTKLKTIWQDLEDFRPIPECKCEGVKPFLDHLHSEYVMIFLMGLNDSYAAVRAQILLMKPIPLITDVCSLLIQEERQRNAGNSSPTVEPIALLASDNSKKSHNSSSNDRTRKKERINVQFARIAELKVTLLTVATNCTDILLVTK